MHFLLSLKTAAGDELVASLVVSILKVCPDLLTKYFREVTFSFLPRVKSTWLNNVKLLNKVQGSAELVCGPGASGRWGQRASALPGCAVKPVSGMGYCGPHDWWPYPVVALVSH